MIQADVYHTQPTYENEIVLLRPLMQEDLPQLLLCYSDVHAVPLFNVDNCFGDDFHYTTPERMAQAMTFWQESYRRGDFVRWAVVDQSIGETVGTVEMFHRVAQDADNHAGVLRIDLQSRFETRAFVYAVLSLCLTHFYDAFAVERILTKAIPQARERRVALEAAGFIPQETAMGQYPFYFARTR